MQVANYANGTTEVLSQPSGLRPGMLLTLTPDQESTVGGAPAKLHVQSGETIRVTEVTRNTAGGRFTYAIYQGRTLRRPLRKGRPSYEIVHPIVLTNGDRQKIHEVNVNSQLGRALLAETLHT